MLNKLILAVLLLGVVPGLANAWTITAKIGSPAGSISCEGQTVSTGTGYIQVANTLASTTVTIQPNGGYATTMVVLDGVNVTVPGATTYIVNYAAKNHTLTAYFGTTTYSVSLNQVSNGNVTAQVVAPTTGAITQTGLTGLAYGNTVEIVASPYTDYALKTLNSTSNLVTTAVFSGQSIVPVKYRFTVDRNISFAGVFSLIPRVTARITASTTQSAVNTPVVIDASTSSTNDPPLSYSYSLTSGDPSKVTFTPITPGSMAAVTFQTSAPGSYVVAVTATSANGGTGTASTPAINVMTPGAYDSQTCLSCHTTRDPKLSNGYLASPHGTGSISVTCSSCHNPGATLSHPYDVNPVGACKGCHTSFNPWVPGHDALVGTDVCANCHDPHATAATGFVGVNIPHYNNVTSAGYPASYVTSRTVCADCHIPVGGSSQAPVRSAWAGSRHAATTDPAWKGEDFKTLDGCVRCHTRTGFLAYSTAKVAAAWGSAPDKTKEVLGCSGCHKSDMSLRVLAPYSSATAFRFKVDAVNSVSVPYKNLDYGPSNLCITCHGGTTSGEIIKLAFGFANFTAGSRLLNHFMAGAGVMDNSIGYEFDGTPSGKNIDFNKQNTWHSGIGLPSAQYDTGSLGPCVACHMSAPGNEHSFAAVFKNSTGSVIQVAGAAVCAKCHPSQLGGGEQMTAQAMQSYKSGFKSALAVLKGELQAKGFDPDAPSQITSWGTTAQQRANNMGAFYNYILLKRNDLAAYVHNPTYARRLIQFSIDWIDNGIFDDSGFTSINMLNLPQATKDAAIDYLGVSFSGTTPNCYSCHKSYYD